MCYPSPDIFGAKKKKKLGVALDPSPKFGAPGRFQILKTCFDLRSQVSSPEWQCQP